MTGDCPISETEAEARAHGICFKNGPPRRTGVELEWLVHDDLDPLRPVGQERLSAALADLQRLPLRSTLTQEPGGQLELSSPPADSLTECVEWMSADLAVVRERLRGHRLRLAGYGHEPWRRPQRLLQLPRYTAMEEYFDRVNPAGRSMMCSTASVQVCLDAGTAGAGPDGYSARWRLAHLVGPVLVAAFANSPLSRGRPTGIRCIRQAVWAVIDPARTAAPASAADPRDAWAAYALNAPVLCIRQGGGRWDVPEKLSFRDWIRDGGRLRSPRPPTADDLAYHLTTLFPPVRPHGHLELRMIDAQPGEDGWIVPLAVAAALLDDPVAAAAAYRAAGGLDLRPYEHAPGNPLWRRAARHGLTDPALHRAAEACFAAAREALPRIGASTAICAAVDRFVDRYVARGRCPADDLLDQTTVGQRTPAGTAPLIGKDGRP